MSWSGTVTCSNCYTQGHNSRSCPKLTEQLQQRFDRAKASGDEWSMKHNGQKLQKRTGIDPMTGQKMKKQRGRCLDDMTCSYCQNTGHTRRTCTDLKEDVAVYCYVVKKNRAAMIAAIENAGIGVGTVIPHRFRGYSSRTDEYGSQNEPKFVNGYRWGIVADSDTALLTGWDFIKTVPLRTLGAGRRDGSANVSINFCQKEHEEGETATLSKTCDIRERMPKGYLEGDGLLEKAKSFFHGESRPGQYGYWKEDYAHVMEARYHLGFDTRPDEGTSEA